MSQPKCLPLQFLDDSCTSATTFSNSLLRELCAEAITNLRLNTKDWIPFDTRGNQAFRAPLSSGLTRDKYLQLLQCSDEQMNVLYPEHKPWTTLQCDPEVNVSTKTNAPIMFHIYPPSTSHQHPHIDSFGGEHEHLESSFHVMAHLLMITSGYLPKLFQRLPHFDEFILGCPEEQLEIRSRELNRILDLNKQHWEIEMKENPPFATQLALAGSGLVFQTGTQIHAGVGTGNYVHQDWDHRVTLFLVKVPQHSVLQISQMQYETTEMPWGLLKPILPSQIQEASRMFHGTQIEREVIEIKSDDECEKTKREDEKEFSVVAFAGFEYSYYLVQVQKKHRVKYMKMNDTRTFFIKDYTAKNVLPPGSIICTGKLFKGCLSAAMLEEFCASYHVQSETPVKKDALFSIRNLLSMEQQLSE